MAGILPNRESALADTAHQFVVIGAQRTGTNILRTVLNTNEEIAMLGEVMSPSPAPAHWDNFCPRAAASHCSSRDFFRGRSSPRSVLRICTISNPQSLGG